MKKNILNIKTLAALLMAGAAFTACSSEDTIIDEQPVNPAEKTYTLTIEASKSNVATTRGLSLDGKTLNAVWKAGDVVEVYKYNNNVLLGTLTPTSTGNNATVLTGTVTGITEEEITKGCKIELHLIGKNRDYSGQKGVLLSSKDPIWSIEKKYDYGHAGISDLITVKKLEEGKLIAETLNGDPANFVNFQAIVKFKLVDKDTDNPIEASRFEIKCTTHSNMIQEKAGSTGITINPSAPTDELYAAIPFEYTPSDVETYVFTAYGGSLDGSTSDVYTYTKQTNSVLFTEGKYYEVTIKMTKKTWNIVDLSQITSNAILSVPDGSVLTGELREGVACPIYIPDGATVKLKNVTIPQRQKYYAGITCNGDVTIILEGENSVTGGYYGSNAYPGIYVTSGKTLTIKGTGTLTATGGGILAAGIGSCNYKNGNDLTYNAGNIVIQGGTINATGGDGAPGIGAGSGSCGNITIEAGNVYANPGETLTHSGYTYQPTAIGTNGISSTCGAISIIGGSVFANGPDPNDTKWTHTVIGGINSTNNASTCPSVTIGTGINQVIMCTGKTTTENNVQVKNYLNATNVTIGSTDFTDELNTDMNDAERLVNLIKTEFPYSSMQNGTGNYDWRFGVKRDR